MTGWLIVNAFLHSKKFEEIGAWLLAAAEKQGICLIPYTNADFLPVYTEKVTGLCRSKGAVLKQKEYPDFVLFWDKDVRLARAFEAQGIRVFNRADAIAACDDKLETHRLLAGSGIRMPETIASPMTFENIGYPELDFLKAAEERFGYPFVIKEAFGSFGAQVYLARDRGEAQVLLTQAAGKPLLFQEYIAASCGRDVRIQVVGGRVVTAMLRCHEHDFRANVTNGGSMKPYRSTAIQEEMALKACELLKLDFAGVDLLFGEDGGPALCEINSNAHFKNIYDCTGVNAAEQIMRYILHWVKD